MEKQMMTVPLSRDLLKPQDFKLDERGDLTIDRKLINKLVKENINKIPASEALAISVAVGISVSVN